MNNIKQALEKSLTRLQMIDAGQIIFVRDAIDDCKSALAELEKCEPVGWMIWWDDREWLFTGDREDFDNATKNNFPITPLYTTPPQQWVGLTLEQITNIGMQHQSLHQVAKAIENKLRSLNNCLIFL